MISTGLLTIIYNASGACFAISGKCFYKRHGKVAGAALGNDAGLIGCVGEANKNPYSLDYRGYFSR